MTDRPLTAPEESAVRRANLAATAVFFCLPAVLPADTVVLHNGKRLEGRIVGGTANQLHLRQLTDSGQSAVTTIDREHIAQIERSPRPAQSRPAGVPGQDGADASAPAFGPAEPTVATASAPSVELTAEQKRALIILVAKLRAEDFAGAAVDVSRLINSAETDDLEALSAESMQLSRKPLADLAAEIHFRAAIASRKGPGLRLPYVTEYEKPALIPMLIRAYEATLASADDELKVEFEAPAPPAETAQVVRPIRAATPKESDPGGPRPWYEAYAQSRPAAAANEPDADGASTILEWIERPTAFEGSAAEAKALHARAYQALSLLNERIRLDSALRRNADLRRRLLTEKQQLTALAKALDEKLDKPKRKTPPDPKAIAAEQARREEYAKRLQEAQEAEQKRMAEAREAARKWVEETQKPKKAFSLFDWLKPAEQNQPAQPEP